jgi:glycosyltransferase involved in cell wall biosynthesis
MIPTYNEEKYIPLCLRSILQQTLRPAQVIICDNESTDDTRQIANKILNDSNIPFHMIIERRKPLIGKWNINFAYWRASKYLQKDLDLVACLEADVVLEKKYYEIIADGFKEDNIGLACGILLPLGFPRPSPLPEPYKMTWGANRVYRYSLWLDLNKIIDLRLLPAWDTDHNILALLRGWKIVQFKEAISWHLRQENPYRGISRGIKYRCIGYPIWWNLYKALKDLDPDLLVGYTCMALWGTPSFLLKDIYRQALISELRERISKAIYR